LTPSRPYLLEAISGAGFDVGGFVAFLVFLVVLGVYGRMLWPTILNAGALIGLGRGSHTLSPNAGLGRGITADNKGPLENVMAAPTGTAVVVVVNVATATPIPVVASPVPSVTPTPNYQEVDVEYSYYNPSLGGINCHSANWDGHRCADTTASGIRWSEYVGRGVAIPPSWLSDGMGYGSILRVVDPGSIAGDYTVIDLCSGCEAGNWADNKWRLDFLDTAQRLTWAYPVKVLLISIVKP
jgi:hypothetical protein